MRVLGIDPGTAVLGFGVVETGTGPHPRLLECGTLTTPPRDPLPSRLRVIHEGTTALLTRHRPDAVAVESAFYGKNVRTTVVLCHARGVILLRGAALKPQVGYMVSQLLRLRSAPAPADAADGVAVALAHLIVATRQAAFFHQVTGAR